MGSSPKNDTSGPPAIQGPPIEQLRPAQPPPKYTEFLPGAVGEGGQMPMATGLTPGMLASIAASNSTTAPPAAAAASTGAAPTSREQLVQLIAELLQGRGGGSSDPSSDQTQVSSGGTYRTGSSHGGAASGRSGFGSHGYSKGGLF